MKKIMLYLIAATTAGCAYQSIEAYERPDGKSMANGQTQPKVTSASQWKMLAENEAKLLKQRAGDNAIFVQQDNSSNFSSTYSSLLTSSLVSNGALVLTEGRNNSFNVSYKVNIVNNNWGKQPPEVDTIPGMVAHYILAGSAEIIKAPLYIGKDQFVKNLSTTTEIVITTQATRQGALLYSASNVYYIEGSNGSQYSSYPTHTTSPAYKAGDVHSISVTGR